MIMEIEWRGLLVGLFGAGAFLIGWFLGARAERRAAKKKDWPTPYPREE